jgi:hypothetical protein
MFDYSLPYLILRPYINWFKIFGKDKENGMVESGKKMSEKEQNFRYEVN